MGKKVWGKSMGKKSMGKKIVQCIIIFSYVGKYDNIFFITINKCPIQMIQKK